MLPAQDALEAGGYHLAQAFSPFNSTPPSHATICHSCVFISLTQPRASSHHLLQDALELVEGYLEQADDGGADCAPLAGPETGSAFVNNDGALGDGGGGDPLPSALLNPAGTNNAAGLGASNGGARGGEGGAALTACFVEALGYARPATPSALAAVLRQLDRQLALEVGTCEAYEPVMHEHTAGAPVDRQLALSRSSEPLQTLSRPLAVIHTHAASVGHQPQPAACGGARCAGRAVPPGCQHHWGAEGGGPRLGPAHARSLHCKCEGFEILDALVTCQRVCLYVEMPGACQRLS